MNLKLCLEIVMVRAWNCAMGLELWYGGGLGGLELRYGPRYVVRGSNYGMDL